MRVLLLLISFFTIAEAIGNTRNCTRREVEGYVDETEHHPGEDGELGYTFLQGSKARDQYLKLGVAEEKVDDETFTKSGTNIECTKIEVVQKGCAQYTCVVRETRRFFWQR